MNKITLISSTEHIVIKKEKHYSVQIGCNSYHRIEMTTSVKYDGSAKTILPYKPVVQWIRDGIILGDKETTSLKLEDSFQKIKN